MACKILPHNFPELLQAQIAILKKQSVQVPARFPDRRLMDAREYADGKGSVKVRAKIKIKDESTVVIKEIPTDDHDRIIAGVDRGCRAEGETEDPQRE
jgi:DNA gyrase/topoisomerase IV subunit A